MKDQKYLTIEAEVTGSETLPVVAENRTSRIDRDDHEIDIGQWYWADTTNYKGETTRRLYCVTKMLSNCVELKSPDSQHSTYVRRVLLTDFEDTCTFEPNAEQVINQKIAGYQQDVQQLMGEVKLLTSRLGVTPRQALNAGEDETQAIALRGSGESVEGYKDALVIAKEKTLPDLFKKINDANQIMAVWMSAALLPLQAQAEGLRPLIAKIEGRIFNVELYAGLKEEVEKIKDGEPAAIDEPIRLFQRRAYMDEECLVNYETGGMRFRNLHKFDQWLIRPDNLARLLPFDRCILAFKVRRNMAEMDTDKVVTISQWISFINESQLDKLTFLYMRNGQQVYRLNTGIEFGAQLFPDTDHSIFNGMVYVDNSGDSIRDIISEGDYKEKVKKETARQRRYEDEMRAWEAAGSPEDQKPRSPGLNFHPAKDYLPWTPENKFYDEIADHIKGILDEHNRLVLVLQGLLDRSPVMHPHAPWQLWTAEGFSQGIKLIYDDSRGLVAGAKPDFELYRAKINSLIKVGSVTIGQDDIWMQREADKENDRRAAAGDERSVKRFRPHGNPGPGELAFVQKMNRVNCTFNWTRERKREVSAKEMRRRLTKPDDHLPCSITVPISDLFNVTEYRPGEYKQFFDDPRTRAEYLQWAPLMLEAEEYHAGNRSVGGDPVIGRPVSSNWLTRGKKQNPIPGSPADTYKVLICLYDSPSKVTDQELEKTLEPPFCYGDKWTRVHRIINESIAYCLQQNWISETEGDNNRTIYRLTGAGFELIRDLTDRLDALPRDQQITYFDEILEEGQTEEDDD